MLANLKIARKLSLLLILPMAAYLFIVTTESYQRWENIQDLNIVEQSLLVSLSVGTVMHEIQKERGLTAGFLSSDGKRFSSELATQTQKTDAAQKNFLKVLQGAARINPLFFKETFTPVETKLKELGGIREAVKAFKLTTLQAIATYNSCVNEMLHAVTEMNAYAESTCVSVSFTSIVQLLHGKEIAGQERASLNAAFSAGKFSKQLYRDWLYRVSAQNTYLKSFADLGGDDAKDMLRAKMQNADDEVTRFRNIAYDNLERSTLDAKPEEWFEASTRRIDKLMDVEEAWGNVLLEKSRHEIHMAWRTLLLSCAFALFVACFTVALGWRICITIGRPLRATLRFAEKITQGDFDTTLNVAQKDEIGGLADVLRAMVAKLKEQIQSAQSQHALAEERGQVAEQCRISAETAEKAAKSRADTLVLAVEKLHGVVETVTFALNDLAEQVRISSEGANAQAHRLDETTTAMEEMSATVIEVAKNAGATAQTAENSRTQATEGSAVVENVVNAILRVQKQSDQMKVDMGLLGKQAEGIGQILNVITDIADQTNLLALNAAIEAARAGDAGRGFAVVADEVRKLAEKTMEATKEVGEAVQGIQGGTRKHILHVEETAGTIEKATDLARKSGDAMRELVELSGETTTQVQSIATASEQQSAASETIHASLEDINQISSSTAEAMEHAVLALNNLRDQTDVLVGIMGDLKKS